MSGALDRIVRELEAAGVPDRVGRFGGLRRRVAEMLVEACRRVGPEQFRAAVGRIVDAVVEEANAVHLGRNEAGGN